VLSANPSADFSTSAVVGGEYFVFKAVMRTEGYGAAELLLSLSLALSERVITLSVGRVARGA
jgi:hypothetical protein